MARKQHKDMQQKKVPITNSKSLTKCVVFIYVTVNTTHLVLFGCQETRIKKKRKKTIFLNFVELSIFLEANNINIRTSNITLSSFPQVSPGQTEGKVSS